MKSKLFFVCVCLAALSGFPLSAAETPPPPAPAKADAKPAANVAKGFPEFIFDRPATEKAAMDINPDDYAEFWKKWHFVSVRWRQDTREIRLSYANDLAWKTLSEQRTDYPVGAMFGKLVYPAEEDLALPSSVLTSNLVSRFMIMLWDPKHKNAGSDGWVYVRFINTGPDTLQDKDSTGLTGVMSKKEVEACVECHNRAYDRGNVFSQPMYLFRDLKNQADWKDNKVLANRFEESMKEMKSSTVPRIATSLIDNFPEWKGRKVMGYAGNFFSGSLGEIAPSLAHMAQKNVTNIYMVFDRDDPNTIQIASSVKKKGYENCVGLVRMRGTGFTVIASGIATSNAPRGGTATTEPGNREMEFFDSTAPSATPGNVGYAARVQNLEQQLRPMATLYVMCGADGVSRQLLPLLYTTKDKDGLPSYYFAPAKVE